MKLRLRSVRLTLVPWVLLLSLATIGAGIAIGAAIWSGGSSSSTGVPVANAGLASSSSPGAPVANAAPKYAPKGGTPNDYGVDATIVFELPPGATVDVFPPSVGEYQNCTADWTRLHFAMTDSPQSQPMYMGVRNTGSCFFENSYNGWQVDVNGVFVGNFYLEQNAPHTFYAACGGMVSGFTCSTRGLTATYTQTSTRK